MKIPEVIKLADDLIFSHTGKHLDYLQKAIINGTLEHKNYTKISEEINCSESHVKNTGAELWQVLSHILGEDITKKNFKHLFNHGKIYNNFSPSFVSDNLTVSNLNFCGEKDSAEAQQRTDWAEAQQRIDWAEAQQRAQQRTDLSYVPQNVNFYGRSLELSILKQWILNDQIRLINIYGLSEVGKSSLIGYFITQIKEHFDYIIWRNLTQFFTLNQLTDNLNQYFLNSEKPAFSQILDYVLNYRCLLILNDLQSLFKTGDFAGEFLPEFEDYSKFFQQVVTSSHQSCVITISWEKPRSLSSLEGKKSPLKTLELKGFDYQNTEIFRENNLLDQDKWSELMSLYQGHPSFLNIISGIINELFNGSVSQFLCYNKGLFLGDIELILSRHLTRLSPLENKVISYLVKDNNYLDMLNIPPELELSNQDFLTVIQSLNRRCLLEKVKQNGAIFFQLNSIFQHFLQQKNY